MSILKSPVGVPVFVLFQKYTHTCFLFVGVNDCDSRYCNHQAFPTALHPFGVVVKLWSTVSFVPTAVNDTREGEGVTREFATGSTTSENVIEFTSNQASDTLPATLSEQ